MERRAPFGVLEEGGQVEAVESAVAGVASASDAIAVSCWIC